MDETAIMQERDADARDLRRVHETRARMVQALRVALREVSRARDSQAKLVMRHITNGEEETVTGAAVAQLGLDVKDVCTRLKWARGAWEEAMRSRQEINSSPHSIERVTSGLRESALVMKAEGAMSSLLETTLPKAKRLCREADVPLREPYALSAARQFQQADLRSMEATVSMLLDKSGTRDVLGECRQTRWMVSP